MANYYKVTTKQDPLRLRQTCSTSATILARMPKGSIVSQNIILVPSDGWIAVNFGSQSGFASADYLTACKEDGTLLEPEKNKEDNQEVEKKENTNNQETNTESGDGNKVMIAGIAAVALGSLAFLFL